MKPTSKSSPFMGRGTTPCLQFSIPYTEPDVRQAVISFKGEQSGHLVEKWYPKNKEGIRDITFLPKEKEGITTTFLEVTLSQQETLGSETTTGFEENEKIIMSVKLLVEDGDGNLSVPYCAPLYTYMGQVLYEEALPWNEEGTSNEQ